LYISRPSSMFQLLLLTHDSARLCVWMPCNDDSCETHRPCAQGEQRGVGSEWAEFEKWAVPFDPVFFR